MKAVGIIPARWHATRLPGKPLAEIAGQPMIHHVYQRASQAASLARVVVATDDERILAAVRAFGGEAVLTSPDHRSITLGHRNGRARWPLSFSRVHEQSQRTLRETDRMPYSMRCNVRNAFSIRTQPPSRVLILPVRGSGSTRW